MHENKYSGFTLLEILIALFIFTMISLMMVSALHNVINIESHTDEKADQLRQLQLFFLLSGRDIEQTINRNVTNSQHHEELAFQGTSQQFTFTHAGYATAFDTVGKSQLQRVRYSFADGNLYRYTWPVLDAAPQTLPAKRLLLKVKNARFNYLDKAGKFHAEWPVTELKEVLPRAVRIDLTIENWGSIQQIFLTNANASQVNNVSKS